MDRVVLSLCGAVLWVGLTAGACERSEPEGSATSSSTKPAAKTVRLIVGRSGSRLGVLEVPPGKPVALALEGDGEPAAALKKLVDEINAGDSFQVKMHLPAKEGERGPLGARLFRRSDDDYAEGVEMKLLDKGYGVERIQ